MSGKTSYNFILILLLFFPFFLCQTPLALATEVDYSNLAKGLNKSNDLIKSKDGNLISFSEWKTLTNKILLDRIAFLKQKQKLDPKKFAKNAFGQDPLASLIQSEQNRLASAEDLTVHDYFVGYVFQQPKFMMYLPQIIKTLTPDEIGSLLRSYSELLTKNRDAGSKQGFIPPFD